MLRVGVVGVGHLGIHHTRILANLNEVELTGIVDIDKNRIDKIARTYNTHAYGDYHDLLGKIEAVVIATPTPLHFEIGKTFLQNGISCLIEKPITSNLAEAEELLALAQAKNLILQIGHVERFNPAVMEAQKYINQPKFIEANRLGPYNPRATNIGVILDLMIHDIDIILYLVHSPITSIEAVGARLLSNFEDIANARINFQNGCVVNISASRVSLKAFRKIRIFQKDSYISLDYAKPSLKVYQKKQVTVKSLQDIIIKHPRLKKIEPLQEELKHFISCVKGGRKPLVSGEHGRDALEVALEIVRKIEINE